MPTYTTEGLDKVARNIGIEGIHLFACSCVRKQGNLPNDLEIQEKYDIAVIEEKPVTKTFFVDHHLGIRGVIPKQDGEADVWFHIEATFRLTYLLSKRRGFITKSDVESFAYINSVVHVWPYWRQFVQTRSTEMGLPTFLLGILPPRQTLTSLIETKKANQ